MSLGAASPALLRPLALAITPNLDREYPHRVMYDAQRDADWLPPRRRHPVFFGAYDWHSSVHSHWALARIARAAAAAGAHDLTAHCADLLHGRLTAEAIERELDFFADRPGFELPYGLAWAALLCAELAVASDEDPSFRPLAAATTPLADLALLRLERWSVALPLPIRSGEHSQSALAMVLTHEAARALGRAAAAAKLQERALALHLPDRDCALHLEPSAWDFVSPTLGAAWLMSRCVPAEELAAWLDRAAPGLGRHPLPLSPSVNRQDGKLAHWDGLLWSRAWMMRALADALPTTDDRPERLRAAALAHAQAAQLSLEEASYAGLHWLPTFATVWHTGGIELRPQHPR
ncbi:MAG: DUF2891 family protein [Myxococcales bacterium]|nr:DUF2891 family protein [Myxococcales bacterium]